MLGTREHCDGTIVNFFGIGGLEVIVIAGLAFFLLGPKKMIETSRSAGKLLRELRVERDKFTDMVMREFDDDDTGSGGAGSKPAGDGGDVSQASAPVGQADQPEGTVSRPRGRMQGMTGDGASADDGRPDDAEDPAPPAGGSA